MNLNPAIDRSSFTYFSVISQFDAMTRNNLLLHWSSAFLVNSLQLPDSR